MCMSINCFRLALMRILRTVYYPVLLVIFAAGIIAASYCGGGEAFPAAGVYDGDNTELSRAVIKTLCENGFVELNDENSLRQGVGNGTYDCGAVIESGFGDSLQRGDTDGVVRFIYSPASFSPRLFQNHIVAAVYGEYAPYITADALADTGIGRDEVFASYDDLTEKGFLFSFLIEEADTVQIGGERSLTYTVFTASLLLFTVVMYSSCGLLSEGVAGRVGAGVDMRCVRIPCIIVRILCMIAASALSCTAFRLLGKTAEAGLFLPMCEYGLLLTAFGIIAASVLVRSGRIQIFSFFIILISLLLCPLYFDVAAVFPAAGQMRTFLPTYWLWMCADNAAVSFAAAVLAVPASVLILYFRLRSVTNKRRHTNASI